MSPRPPPADIRPRLRRWLIPAALLALTPKCLLCLAAYAGIATALGLGGPEFCGAPGGTAGAWTGIWPALALGAGLVALFRRA